MEKVIRIGTRSSELALWQTNIVAKQLEHLDYKTEIVKIDSEGDLILDKPLYELGITGVFTRNLDVAMLHNKIDIAVHSFKDVPTILPEKIVQASVLKRGSYNDILVFNNNEEFLSQKSAIIATGSLRRKAQWLHRYPEHTLVDLRGNVNTRLKKLRLNDWNGAIFAAAGLKRINLLPDNHVVLDWMLPAPAQGTIMITALKSDKYTREACAKINDEETQICTNVEREFLNALEGGCTAPIGALAYIKDKKVTFKGVLFSVDGKRKIEVSKTTELGEQHTIAKYCAGEIIERGGKRIMIENEVTLSKKNSIYSTKKISESQIKLFNNDIQVSYSDFIQIRINRISSKVIKNEIENVIITSQNAVESLLASFSPDELQFNNIYCVGRRTRRLIERQIGKVNHSENNAKKLAEFLVENLKEGDEVTFFCSQIRLDELPTILADKNIIVNEVQAYKTMCSPIKVEEKIKGVLFYSPSAVQCYLSENKANIIAFCIGETTATEAKKHFTEVKIAKSPSTESIIELVNLNYE